MNLVRSFLVLVLLSVLFGCSATKEPIKTEPVIQPAAKTDIRKNFHQQFSEKGFFFQNSLPGKIDSLRIDSASKRISIYFDERFAENAIREETTAGLRAELTGFFETDYAGYRIEIFARKNRVEDLIPNYYRTNINPDSRRNAVNSNLLQTPIVNRASSLNKPNRGLSGRNILLWQSHGWYFNNTLKRWEWQRPRLFQIVEDKLPLSFTIPYLIPMLENAGANVFVPRERDIQVNEVILDNDMPSGSSKGMVEVSKSKNPWTKLTPGFAPLPDTVFDNLNPFTTGSYLQAFTDTAESNWIDYIPNIPETGVYSVTVSYHHSPDNTGRAVYTVAHAGGESKIEVNQTAGGSTWIYLGSFKFFKGQNEKSGKVRVTNKSEENKKIITADAVRFGGGMGFIARDSIVSNRPKYLEGARYWMQFAGMPDTITYSLNKNQNDYNDDYQCRSEYGNYLYGKPFGPSKQSDAHGLGIPVHLSLSFHTDAGVSRNDTVIGTLSIYSSTDYDSLPDMPDGVSRMANRDLADIMQTQIVDDIEKTFSTYWNRRQLRDSRYSESVRPNFPSVLLELLSHQSFTDMKFGVDPRFKFVVSRSIYKSMLRFLSSYYGFKYTVQPLPVDNMHIMIDDQKSMLLHWKPVQDKLEPTATPESYIVYTRIDSGGFDNGTLVSGTNYKFSNPAPGKIYSFKVTAVNKGGESFPSEILSAAVTKNSRKPVLIVNAFDRICGPASFNSGDYAGFLNVADEGVPDKYQIDFVGPQYDFDFNSNYMSNDAPGHGASAMGSETDIIAGNTFDFPYIHGQALLANGVSFTSVSDEAFSEISFPAEKYELIDVVAGEELITSGLGTKANEQKDFILFTEAFRNKLTAYLNQKGKLFLSGSHIGKELFSFSPDTTWRDFGINTLKARGYSPKSSSDGKVFSVSKFFNFREKEISFNTGFSQSIYKVESPDGFYPSPKAEPLLRYSENSFCAAYGYKDDYGLVLMGFPFETVSGSDARTKLMKAVLNYLRY